MLKVNQWIKPGKWAWLVCDEGNGLQNRRIVIILDRAKEGEISVVWRKDENKFSTDTVMVKDLIPLNSCTGWDYLP